MKESKASRKTEPKKEGSSGFLVVITGASGVGKDSVVDCLLGHTKLNGLNLRRLITCADRPPRPEEKHGVDYYFVTPEELDRMHLNGDLVETPQQTGTSRKGTPRKELLCVLNGESLIWRIDPFLASKVASGEFFQEQFPGEEGERLRELTKVFCISASHETLLQRRKKRDKEYYSESEYVLRDEQEGPILKKLTRISHAIENKDGLLASAIEEIVAVINP